MATVHKDMPQPVLKRKPPKKASVDHIEIHPAMNTGHRVEAHFANSGLSEYKEPEKKEFAGPHAKVSLPKGHILAHIAGHMGIPMETEAENQDGTNT